MNKLDIMDKLGDTIRKVFENDDIEVNDATSAHDVDEWDSLAHISLIEEIEKVFKVKFALGELMKLQNVGQMADLIVKKTAK
jgi:acyl carrier protein